MRIIQITLSLAIFMCLGCASKGFNRDELKKQIGVINPVTDDADIAYKAKKKALNKLEKQIAKMIKGQ